MQCDLWRSKHEKNQECSSTTRVWRSSLPGFGGDHSLQPCQMCRYPINVIIFLLCFSIESIIADSLDFQFPANLVSGQLGVPAMWIVVMEPKRESEPHFKNQNMEEQPVHLWRKQRPAVLPAVVPSITFILHSALQSLFSVVVSLRVTSATTLEVLPDVSVNFTLGAQVQSSTTDDQGAASFKLRWG